MMVREASVSGQGNELRELLALRGERFTPNDCPRIGDFDALLEALRLHHGPEGRPDLQPIPHTTSTPEPVSGMAEPVQVAQPVGAGLNTEAVMAAESRYHACVPAP